MRIFAVIGSGVKGSNTDTRSIPEAALKQACEFGKSIPFEE